MMLQGRASSVDDNRLRSRVVIWSGLSFLMFLSSLFMIFFGGPSAGAGRKAVWTCSAHLAARSDRLLLLPPGCCSPSAGRAEASAIPFSLGNLAAAEIFSLLLPVKEVSGLVWETGNGLVPAISFAALAITSLTWTATALIDPSRTNRTAYTVALAAVLIIGFLLSYNYFWSLQGAMVAGLAAALFWGMSYDHRLHPYKKLKVVRSGSPGALLPDHIPGAAYAVAGASLSASLIGVVVNLEPGNAAA